MIIMMVMFMMMRRRRRMMMMMIVRSYDRLREDYDIAVAMIAPPQV